MLGSGSMALVSQGHWARIAGFEQWVETAESKQMGQGTGLGLQRQDKTNKNGQKTNNKDTCTRKIQTKQISDKRTFNAR